jgi:hypothetical protein
MGVVHFPLCFWGRSGVFLPAVLLSICASCSSGLLASYPVRKLCSPFLILVHESGLLLSVFFFFSGTTPGLHFLSWTLILSTGASVRWLPEVLSLAARSDSQLS